MRPVKEQFATIDGVRLCYETFGDESRPALLLVMGLGTQMIGWHADFCSQLADRGFFVVRYDNRDVGRSTHFDHRPPPTAREIVTRRHRNPAAHEGGVHRAPREDLRDHRLTGVRAQ
jgi:pimeloyl-ACP methyl ester carboxylesterase